MEKSLLKNIENALEEIRPFLKNDGGDISLVSIEKDIVKVKFEGACSTCTVNQMTLKSGVEMIIKKHVPKIQQVVSVEEI
nr:nitrogen fixation protein NifU [uncultured bacterium]|tara:strand:- start:4887 stop:5126 length:240 start_codon:yes stop_codon:yes gene_type:complete